MNSEAVFHWNNWENESIVGRTVVQTNFCDANNSVENQQVESSYRYATVIQGIEKEWFPISIEIVILTTEILHEFQNGFFFLRIRSIRFGKIFRMITLYDRSKQEKVSRKSIDRVDLRTVETYRAQWWVAVSVLVVQDLLDGPACHQDTDRGALHWIRLQRVHAHRSLAATRSKESGDGRTKTKKYRTSFSPAWWGDSGTAESVIVAETKLLFLSFTGQKLFLHYHSVV